MPCLAARRCPFVSDYPEIPAHPYREVKSPTLLDILKDDNWPDDLRKYRARLGRGAGVPTWLIIADREIVGRGYYGGGQWQSAILLKLEALLR